MLDEFQVLGYPVLSMRSIPKDPVWLRRFFQDDLDAGRVTSPLSVSDVWPENYSANSVMKVWAAKFAARHPNVAVLDLSSFKCGHDAPTYGLVDSIIAAASTPWSALHDIDANKPGGSIKIRVKTYAHSLKLHEERLTDVAAKREELAFRVDQKRLALLQMKQAQVSERTGRLDPAVSAQIQEVRARVAEWEARRAPVEQEAPRGQVVPITALGKRRREAEVSVEQVRHGLNKKGLSAS